MLSRLRPLLARQQPCLPNQRIHTLHPLRDRCAMLSVSSASRTEAAVFSKNLLPQTSIHGIEIKSGVRVQLRKGGVWDVFRRKGAVGSSPGFNLGNQTPWRSALKDHQIERDKHTDRECSER
jgi:hypothetical protein